jgi:polyribonucleotide nucleotidyltransferase
MNFFEDSCQIDDKKLTLQVGKLAKASNVAVLGKLGDTCVLVTINTSKTNEDLDYLPLHVEYVEKLYAGGKIKGSRWVKREGKPSDEAVLNARLIDRGIRPFFPKNYNKSIQVIITLLSIDGINSPEILAAITTSAALHISSIPWNGPLGTVRIGCIKTNGDYSYIVNPDENELSISYLDMIVTSTKEKVVMIEAQAEILSESTIIKGIEVAKKENKKIIDFIDKFREKVSQQKEKINKEIYNQKITTILKKDFSKEIDELIKYKAEKEFDDESATKTLLENINEKYKDEFENKEILQAIDYVVSQTVRDGILKSKKRLDNRKPEDIRDIYIELSTLPRTHGSAIFQRGDTQVLSIVTLGSPDLEQLIESPIGEESKRYIHHYYMPPYSLGEVGRLGYPSRREVGHGALAEKALEVVLPPQKDFPYTVRVVSEVLSSNGSTSMASTCGSTLALMDAGVPIKGPVAGIAMGMISKSDSEYIILTDIIGIEDFIGDMDFKIAGTTDGVTAIQLDVKNQGLTDKMINEILERAKTARDYILTKMNKIIEKPRTEVSKFAPKVIVIAPPKEKIGEIIGPGGKNIRSLIAKTNTEINITSDEKVTISGPDKDNVEKAANIIKNMIREVEVGEVFDGEVKRMLPFGAFVEILPGKEGLVHVSKMGKGFVKRPEDVVKIGQKIKVKVIQIDNQKRINLQLIT